MDKAEIKRLESKMLDFKLRTRDESPAKALSAEERLVYAEFLEMTNQPMAAEFFRNYKDEPKKK